MTLVRYIDQNPLQAGLSDETKSFPHASRVHYARRSGPRWLSRERIEAAVCAYSGVRPYDPRCYSQVFGAPLAPEVCELLERGVLRGDRVKDQFGDLLGLASAGARERLGQRQALADGCRGSPMLAPAIVVRAVVTRLRQSSAPWTIQGARMGFDGWDVLEAALLRSLSGESQEAIARMVGTTRTRFRENLDRHSRLLSSDARYARRYEEAIDAVRRQLREGAGLTGRSPAIRIEV
jgi:hypothetical protein